ncbi:RNI-like protein [Fragilariopsis cylindrus CCMP1102]|uniref:RNI-like protein n=1 Tax=Fragilariopsis cylindrus CCMP1102 TaxID=635003 RepID=A0A1E7F0K0_9STRA|nr:RNI-like protein [Fragilariopsis cylindrus CCMP1102]|eukprot:OEU11758.1 RNI-like protein [Fragilariopsis cylindrus CCMP1102]
MFLNLDGGSGSTDIVERLVLERKRRTAKSIGFDAVDVDEAILQAAVVLFRDRQQQQQQQQQQQRHPQQQQQQQPHQQRSISIDNNTNNNCHNKNITLEKLCINNCPVNPYLEYLIEAAMGMDLFSELELQGNIEDENENENEEENTTDENNSNNNSNNNNTNSSISNSCNTNNVFALDALGFRMRFSRRLRKLELINLPMTRDHAESLMYGIETNHSTGTGCRLDTLFLENVRFEDGDDNDNDDNNNNEEDDDAGEEEEEEEDDDIGNDDDGGTASNSPRQQQDAGTVVIQELCEGFPNNRTLKTIELQRCRLTDSQIALIFDTLSVHPTLTSLNLSENFCRKLGLEALDRMLTSSPPPQQQQQQQQQQSNGGINNNSNSKEKNGTSGDDHRQQHEHKQNHCRLESLDLSYQFINTSEETYGMTGSGEEEEQRIQLNILTRNCTTRDACDKIYPNLRKLVLCGNQIDDSDMKDLAFLIRHRFPRLEEIDLRFNDITTDGLQTFADYSDPNNDDNFFTTNNNNYNDNDTTSNKTNTTNNVRKTQHKDHFPPPSSRLRIIRLTNNPLVMTNQTSIILLKLLKIYPELQLIQSNLEWENGTSIAMDIQHLVDINRAGRVLLLAGSSGSTCCDTSGTTSSRRREGNNDGASPISSPSSSKAAVAAATSMKSQQQLSPEEGRRRKQQHTHQRRPIPLSAWPLVLARLTRKARYPHYIPKKNSMNGMFYLIRHGPIIVEQISSRGGKSSIHNNSNNKNGKTNNNEDQDRNDRRPKRKWGDPALGGYETLEDFLRDMKGVRTLRGVRAL